MTSEEFLKESIQNKSGKNKGKRSIKFNGMKVDKAIGKRVEYCKERFKKYLVKDFSRLKA